MFDETLLEQLKTNRQERRAIVYLLVGIVLVVALNQFVLKPQESIESTNPELQEVLDSYYKEKSKEEELKEINPPIVPNKTTIDKKPERRTPKIEMFVFDPNEVDYDGLLKLGFTSRQANTLLKFRQSGFEFREPEDLLKVYGIDDSMLSKLKPYLNLPEKVSKQKESRFPNQANKDEADSSLIEIARVKKPEIILPAKKIEINRANHEELMSIYGIGKVYADIIINYRDRLGGYRSLTQLQENYEFSDSTMTLLQNAVTIDTFQIKKINLNVVTFKGLLAHPYIDYEECKILFPYIESRRPINNIDILDSILEVDKATILKLKPYVDAQLP